jgi:hypothetical protein
MSDQDTGGQRAYRTIDLLRTRAYEALVEYRRQQGTYGGAATETRQELASSALALRERLLNFRDSPALRRPWDERGVDWIAEAARETVMVEESLPRSNGNTRTVVRSALTQADPERVADTVQELMAITRELGFEAPERKVRPRGRIGSDDVGESET